MSAVINKQSPAIDGNISLPLEFVRKMQTAENYADQSGNFTLYRAVCREHCNKGYKGRIGLHELMIGSDKIKGLLQERARVSRLLAAALEDGMPTLKMDGIEKVPSGATCLKQVRQVRIK